MTRTPTDDLPVIARLCSACGHYCGYCQPNCPHGPTGDEHTDDVGMAEPPCYRRHSAMMGAACLAALPQNSARNEQAEMHTDQGYEARIGELEAERDALRQGIEEIADAAGADAVAGRMDMYWANALTELLTPPSNSARSVQGVDHTNQPSGDHQ